MAKGKTKLANALISQTARLQSNAQARDRQQRIADASRAKSKSQSSKSKSHANKQRERAKQGLNPFSSPDRILLIGEADFSFACALVKDGTVKPENIVATTLDAEDMLNVKYPSTAERNIRELRENGVKVVCGVDATKLDVAQLGGSGKKGQGVVFDKVVWNFPHAGKGIADQDRNIRENQQLLLNFLYSVKPLLAQGSMPTSSHSSRKRKRTDDDEDEDIVDDQPDVDDDGELQTSSNTSSGSRGTVLITLRDAPPYSLWDLPSLAKRPTQPGQPRYVLIRSFAFASAHWRTLGYAHKMTKGHVEGVSVGHTGTKRTWQFALADDSE